LKSGVFPFSMNKCPKTAHMDCSQVVDNDSLQ
jgi:hypothetical protein